MQSTVAKPATHLRQLPNAEPNGSIIRAQMAIVDGEVLSYPFTHFNMTDS